MIVIVIVMMCKRICKSHWLWWFWNIRSFFVWIIATEWNWHRLGLLLDSLQELSTDSLPVLGDTGGFLIIQGNQLYTWNCFIAKMEDGNRGVGIICRGEGDASKLVFGYEVDTSDMTIG